MKVVIVGGVAGGASAAARARCQCNICRTMARTAATIPAMTSQSNLRSCFTCVFLTCQHTFPRRGSNFGTQRRDGQGRSENLDSTVRQFVALRSGQNADDHAVEEIKLSKTL